jgi:hypothetical protein
MTASTAGHGGAAARTAPRRSVSAFMPEIMPHLY